MDDARLAALEARVAELERQAAYNAERAQRMRRKTANEFKALAEGFDRATESLIHAGLLPQFAHLTTIQAEAMPSLRRQTPCQSAAAQACQDA